MDQGSAECPAYDLQLLAAVDELLAKDPSWGNP